MITYLLLMLPALSYASFLQAQGVPIAVASINDTQLPIKLIFEEKNTVYESIIVEPTSNALFKVWQSNLNPGSAAQLIRPSQMGHGPYSIVMHSRVVLGDLYVPLWDSELKHYSLKIMFPSNVFWSRPSIHAVTCVNGGFLELRIWNSDGSLVNHHTYSGSTMVDVQLNHGQAVTFFWKYLEGFNEDVSLHEAFYVILTSAAQQAKVNLFRNKVQKDPNFQEMTAHVTFQNKNELIYYV